MGDQVFTFIPQTREELTWLWAGILIFVVAGTLTVFVLFRQKGVMTQPRKALLAMLLFFAAILGAGSALFSGLALARLKPLEIDANGFVLGKKQVNWQEVRELRMVQSQEHNMLNVPTSTTRLMVLRLTNGKDLYFSEASYPVNEILGALRSVQPELME